MTGQTTNVVSPTQSPFLSSIAYGLRQASLAGQREQSEHGFTTRILSLRLTACRKVTLAKAVVPKYESLLCIPSLRSSRISALTMRIAG